MSKIPNRIPVFPLAGALLLPSGNLPLNIFEPRYIAMIDYALKNDKLIGMIQTKEGVAEELYTIGCVGKITSFSETDDNRYLINLKGLLRFKLLNETHSLQGFRIFNVKYNSLDRNFNKFDTKQFNKKKFIKKVKSFFENRGLLADWDSLEKFEEKSLIIMISMLCPFNVIEKQMLLESKNMNTLADSVIALFDFSLNRNINHETIN